MYPGGPNPTQVQYVPAGKAANPPLPLVLIHDGGGTTFSYFLLGSLGRDVWAVHNPRYFEGVPWEGGMDEMARRYLEVLGEEGIEGPIMLGGWSLGGFLSIAMAHLIALNPNAYPISIAGLLLIDSPYHIARSKITRPIAEPRLDDLPELVRRSFDHCDAMLQDWDLPQWRGNAPQHEQVRMNVAGEEVRLGAWQVLYKPATGGGKTWESISTTPRGTVDEGGGLANLAPGSPPPGVLIRCTRSSRAKGKQPCLVDLDREEKLLGWEGRFADFVRAVVDVDADHYGMFDRMDMERMEDVTARVGWGLEVLDALVGGSTVSKGVH